jgi:opacity protein-like surface antigen
MKNITKLVAISLMSMTSSAMAATGAYVAADVGPASYGYGSSNPVSIRLGGGYNFMKLMNDQLTIGAEANLENFGSSSYLNTTVKTTGLMVAGVATYKLPGVDRLSAFGKVGMMHASTDYTQPGISVTSTSNNPFIGIGAKYDINDQVAVRAQYEDFGNAVSVQGASSSLTELSAGVIYSF